MNTPYKSKLKIMNELAEAVAYAIQMMDEAYPDVMHEDLPPAAKKFDSMFAIMSDDTFAAIKDAEQQLGV